MESLALLADGVSRATSPELLIATLIGVIVGLVVGVLPGIGPAAGTAIMLPVAVGFGGAAAIAGLAGIYYGAMFGGRGHVNPARHSRRRAVGHDRDRRPCAGQERARPDAHSG